MGKNFFAINSTNSNWVSLDNSIYKCYLVHQTKYYEVDHL